MTDRPPGVRDPAHRMDMYCDGCGQIDQHPRHHHAGDDGTYTRKHFDCCHAAGCPDGSCGHFLGGSGLAHGDGLRAWLEARMAEDGGLPGWLQARRAQAGG